MKRILIIHPPSPFLVDERSLIPLGAVTVATVMNTLRDYDAGVLDLAGNPNYIEDTLDCLGLETPDAVGISTTTQQTPRVTPLVQAIRKEHPNLHLVAGGAGPTNDPATYLRIGFNKVVRNEGEFCFNAWQPGGDPVITPPLLEDLDILPFANRNLVNVKSYTFKVRDRDGKPLPSTHIMSTRGCPFSCGHCLSGDSLVATPRGYYRLREIFNPDSTTEPCDHGYIALKGGYAGLNIVRNGIFAMFKVHCSRGYSVEGTSDHQILTCENGTLSWKEIRQLKPGDYLAVRPRAIDPEPQRIHWKPPPEKLVPGGFRRRPLLRVPLGMDESLALFLGYLIGDGCVSKDRRTIQLATRPEDIPMVTRMVKRVFGILPRPYPMATTDRCVNLQFVSSEAWDFIVSGCGVDPFNKLRVPRVVLGASRRAKLAFWAGLYLAGGYLDPKGTRYLATSSKTLAEEVHALLLSCGLFPTIHTIPQKGLMSGDGYRVNFNALNNHHDGIPLGTRAYWCSKCGKIHLRKTNSDGRRTLSRSILRQIQPDHPLLEYAFVRVKSIEPVGEKEAFDIYNHPDSQYEAGGIVVHNCCGREQEYYRRYRAFSPDRVVRELEFIRDNWGFTAIQDYADEVNVDRKWLLDYCQRLKGKEFVLRSFCVAKLFDDEVAKAMASSGWTEVCFGVESGSAELLKRSAINKTTPEASLRAVRTAHKHGIRVKTFLMVGLPGETRETVEKTKQWLLEARPDDYDLSIFTPMPGSPIYDHADKFKGAISFTPIDFAVDDSFYKGRPGRYEAKVSTPGLTRAEIVALRDEVDFEVRKALGIPHYSGGVPFEHSMGQPG